LKRFESEASLKDLLSALVTKYESGRPVPWQYEPEAPFQQGLLGGIVGFEIEITRLEGKWKLNQNHSRERRERVVEALKEGGTHDQVEIARLMEETL
jgi:transcriptional regulator